MSQADALDSSTATPLSQVTIWRVESLAYPDADHLMRTWQQQRIKDQIEDRILFCEHPEVVTLGRRARRDQPVVPSGYPQVDVDRGGGLTWHGPGQLVVYPIIRWNGPGERSVGLVIRLLEEWTIQALAQWNINAGRDQRMAGVWIGDYKIASIGLSFQHWVSRHGLAINLNTHPQRVENLDCCGLKAGMTTSIARLSSQVPTRRELENKMMEFIPTLLQREIRSIEQADHLEQLISAC